MRELFFIICFILFLDSLQSDSDGMVKAKTILKHYCAIGEVFDLDGDKYQCFVVRKRLNLKNGQMTIKVS